MGIIIGVLIAVTVLMVMVTIIIIFKGKCAKVSWSMNLVKLPSCIRISVMSLKSGRAVRHRSKNSKLPLMWFNVIIMWLINKL